MTRRTKPSRAHVKAALRVLMGHGSFCDSVDKPSAEETIRKAARIPDLCGQSCYVEAAAEAIIIRALGY